MRSIIIDDDAMARLLVSKSCSRFPKINLLGEFESAVEAIKFLNTNEVEVIFLDIHMPILSGFDFIESLETLPKIILTTSDENVALMGFKYPNVVDYLLKPIRQERFKKAIDKLDNFIVRVGDNNNSRGEDVNE